MNKIEIISGDQLPIKELKLGDIYLVDEDFYIVGVQSGERGNALYNLKNGYRFGEAEVCLDAVNNKDLIKLQPGTVIQLTVQ